MSRGNPFAAARVPTSPDQGSNPTCRGSRFQNLLVPLRIVIISRVGLFILVYLSLVFIPTKSGEGIWSAFPENRFLDGWSRWDSGWYMDIADRGYGDAPKAGTEQRDIVFWPLYPLIVRAVRPLLGSTHLAGIIVSNTAFLLACLLLYQHVRSRYDQAVAARTIVLICAYPFSFYFSASYSDAVFFLAVVAAFYFGGRQWWFLGGLFAAVAGATRPLGVLCVIGLALLYIERVRAGRKRIGMDMAWILLGLLGSFGFPLYLFLERGDPLLFWTARNVPGWADMMTVDRFVGLWPILFSGKLSMHHINVFFGLLGLVLSGYSLIRNGRAEGAWAFLLILASFTSFTGLGRHVAPVFPVFLSGAILSTRTGHFETVCYVFCLLLALFSIMFSHWYWVT
ncbi:MAG: mannosyltransferase family protein [Desulfomonilaceae bacterium]